MLEVVYLLAIKDRAEAVLVTPTPALSEALISAGVQHLMNLTLSPRTMKFQIAYPRRGVI